MRPWVLRVQRGLREEQPFPLVGDAAGGVSQADGVDWRDRNTGGLNGWCRMGGWGGTTLGGGIDRRDRDTGRVEEGYGVKNQRGDRPPTGEEAPDLWKEDEFSIL